MSENIISKATRIGIIDIHNINKGHTKYFFFICIIF